MNTFLELAALAAGIAAIGGATAALWRWVFAPILKGMRGVSRFLEDWNGEPERPGFEGRDGVMERLARTEHAAKRAEFHLGNGSPIAFRKEVNERLERLEERIDPLEDTMERYHGPMNRRHDDPK